MVNMSQLTTVGKNCNYTIWMQKASFSIDWHLKNICVLMVRGENITIAFEINENANQ